MSKTAQILRIEKISPNDGKGLRTVVFFKGCPLKCVWCSTPESQKMASEIYYQAAKCVSCGVCTVNCPQEALSLQNNRILQIDRQKCRSCFTCTDVCTTGALGIYGKQMTVKEVLKQILKDEIFYYHSGGGVTLSGGDVLRQADFARELLIGCKEAGIHTMAELDMFGDYECVAKLLPYLDAFYVDLKIMDSIQHKKWTGVDNHTILENTKKAAQECKKGALHVRVPLIWNINDSQENIIKTAEFCKNLASCQELEFLPYHRLGQITYEYLGKTYALEQLSAMTWKDAWERVKCLEELQLPFETKIAGRPIKDGLFS